MPLILRRRGFVLIFASAVALTAGAGKDAPSIGAYMAGVRQSVVHQIRSTLERSGSDAELSGVVTYAGDGVFYLQHGHDGIKVKSGGLLPRVGERVVARGTPSLEGGHVVFQAKKWTALGMGKVPAARPLATGAALVESGEGTKNVNGIKIVFEGRAIEITERGFSVNIDGVPVNVMTETVPDFVKDCDRLHPLVRVTGVLEQLLDQSALLDEDDYVIGVKVHVASADDIVLKADLDYLYARHEQLMRRVILSVAAVAIVALFVFFIVIFRQRRGLFRTRTIMAERKRMADDIHDTIEQHLVGAGMLLKVNRLKEAQDVLVRAKREIRDIVWGLKNDDMMRQTPAEMLRALAHDENLRGIWRVDTRLDGLPESMDAAAMRDLSLIVREAIGNAVKHGGAKKIAISSDPLDGGGWRLRLSNDGAPFDPKSAPGVNEGHFGLEGMRERALRIGATLSFEPRGNGMVLVLEKRI